jgi:cation/acetate symporter
MIYDPSPVAVIVFFVFVGATVGISFYVGRKAKSSAGYFAAHGQIPWAVNGVAFAGDYLSAASFLGICGMIASYGYDGFLYSIGFLAGWIVALFVIAEPMKRLGRFTFADALDSKFDSRGIKAAAGISTLVVSVFYLIPQMVGAGSLIQPLLGFPHWVGVVLVGIVVITIVVTAGMVSTTWVQFLKGSLLVVFSAVLVVLLLGRGFEARPEAFETLGPMSRSALEGNTLNGQPVIEPTNGWDAHDDFIRLERPDGVGFDLYHVQPAMTPQRDGEATAASSADQVVLRRAQSISDRDGERLIDGAPLGRGKGERELKPVGTLRALPEGKSTTGPLGPIEFFTTLGESDVVLWRNTTVTHQDGTKSTVYYQKLTDGDQVLRPGEHPKFAGIRSDALSGKMNFLSLMLALFCGTASLPHILIRYYTVKDGAAARKSTIVGIASIGFFYVLTLYLGLGAMTSGAMDLTDSNMAAPLLARSISTWLFAIISAIAFTTVLGTVSGLILASSGAVAHDLLVGVAGIDLPEAKKVRIAKFAAVVVGGIAILLGIVFKEMNVGYLVGWAFSVAASANLPALVMLLFWKQTTKQGIVASVLVGMFSSLGWILLSSDTYKSVYGLDPESALAPFSQPGIVTIPLAFVTLIVVSLMTQPKAEAAN